MFSYFFISWCLLFADCFRDDFVTVLQDNTPVMVKIYSTLGRKFNKKDLEDAQRMGQELVMENSAYSNMELGVKLGMHLAANRHLALFAIYFGFQVLECPLNSAW